MKKILWIIKKVAKDIIKITVYIKYIFTKKNGILIYVGLHKGRGLKSIFSSYEKCYAFEANPELYIELKKEFKIYPRVKVFNAAVTNYDGEIDFNISSNNAASSSIGNFSKDWRNDIKMVKTIKVPCLNLFTFLKKKNIDFIEEYISDIQGLDLEVLKTLKPYLDRKKIKNITCEVAKNKNIYDLPDNSEKGFKLLLSNNYKLVSKGWGILKDGEFNEVPETWWEMDCKWQIKT